MQCFQHYKSGYRKASPQVTTNFPISHTVYGAFAPSCTQALALIMKMLSKWAFRVYCGQSQIVTLILSACALSMPITIAQRVCTEGLYRALGSCQNHYNLQRLPLVQQSIWRLWLDNGYYDIQLSLTTVSQGRDFASFIITMLQLHWPKKALRRKGSHYEYLKGFTVIENMNLLKYQIRHICQVLIQFPCVNMFKDFFVHAKYMSIFRPNFLFLKTVTFFDDLYVNVYSQMWFGATASLWGCIIGTDCLTPKWRPFNENCTPSR